VNRLDNCRSVCRKVYGQATASIVEFQFHAELNNTD
jgi:phage tail protein X